MTGGAAAGDTGIPGGALLIDFAEAVVGRDDTSLERARAALAAAPGAPALVDAAGIVGFFSGIVRIADATGTPVDAQMLEDSADLRRELGIDAFAAAGAPRSP